MGFGIGAPSTKHYKETDKGIYRSTVYTNKHNSRYPSSPKHFTHCQIIQNLKLMTLLHSDLDDDYNDFIWKLNCNYAVNIT